MLEDGSRAFASRTMLIPAQRGDDHSGKELVAVKIWQGPDERYVEFAILAEVWDAAVRFITSLRQSNFNVDPPVAVLDFFLQLDEVLAAEAEVDGFSFNRGDKDLYHYWINPD